MPNSRINTLSRFRCLLLYPVWLVTALWTRSLRFECTPEAQSHLSDTSSPTIILFWHNRLFLGVEVYRRFRHPRPIYGLISASKDGAWLTAFAEMVGLRTVRGSSSRRGREALFELARCLSEGNDVAITPDGPRGPIYTCKPGPVILIRRSRKRVLLVGSSAAPGWRLRSWDRFIIPRPFSTIKIDSRMISAEGLPTDWQECGEILRSTLVNINDD